MPTNKGEKPRLDERPRKLTWTPQDALNHRHSLNDGHALKSEWVASISRESDVMHK